jgi:purine-binding chemotaxis protein CheW
MTQIATFRIEDRFYGTDILLVREINRSVDLTPVPHAPAYIRGLMNLRGQIVTVIDLGARLGLPDREADDESHVVILKRDDELRALEARGEAVKPVGCGDTVGFLVDGVGDVVQATDAIREPSPANVGETEARFLSGVVKTDAGLVALLDVAAIVKVV